MRAVSVKAAPTLRDGLAAALGLSRELPILESAASQKLTAAAFVGVAGAYAGVSDEGLDALERRLAAPEFEVVRAGIGRLAHDYVQPTYLEPWPPARAATLDRTVGDEAARAAAAAGISVLALSAVAARQAAARAPAAFGTATDRAAAIRRAAEMRAELASLSVQMQTAWGLDDLTIEDPGSREARDQGLAVVRIAWTNGAVPLFPLDTLGERLTNWARAAGWRR
jgi:hypothetical protein